VSAESEYYVEVSRAYFTFGKVRFSIARSYLMGFTSDWYDTRHSI
jgi:hypothetical protein